jgi:ferric-dicitrate binding protein FerR (iron transport regulator)
METNNTDNLFKNKVDQIDDLPQGVNWNEQKAWQDYQKQFGKRKTSLTPLLPYAAVAALLAIFFSVFYYQNNSGKHIRVNNQTAKVKEVILPDGNHVWLNKNSSIAYSSKPNTLRYELSVNGEVYIEISIKKSEEYIIKTQNALISTKTPTKVNIRNYSDEENINITVSEGIVKVKEESYPDGLSLLLKHGNYCSVHKEQRIIFASIIKNDNYLAWKTGKLTFKDLSIETVADVLAEYYDTPIELKNKSIAYCKFTGSFENQPLDLVLGQIQSKLNFVIKNTGNKIIISGKGCL